MRFGESYRNILFYKNIIFHVMGYLLHTVETRKLGSDYKYIASPLSTPWSASSFQGVSRSTQMHRRRIVRDARNASANFGGNQQSTLFIQMGSLRNPKFCCEQLGVFFSFLERCFLYRGKRAQRISIVAEVWWMENSRQQKWTRRHHLTIADKFFSLGWNQILSLCHQMIQWQNPFS